MIILKSFNSVLYMYMLFLDKKVNRLLPCYIIQVRKFIMSPVKDPKVELVIVMFIVPLVVNVSLKFILIFLDSKPC